MPYRIEYSPDAVEHLEQLTATQRATVLDTVDEQLLHEPTVETRNRKPMRPSPVAPWELRIGDLRVCCDFQETPERLVSIRAVGIKAGNRVRIGGEEVDL